MAKACVIPGFPVQKQTNTLDALDASSKFRAKLLILPPNVSYPPDSVHNRAPQKSTIWEATVCVLGHISRLCAKFVPFSVC